MFGLKFYQDTPRELVRSILGVAVDNRLGVEFSMTNVATGEVEGIEAKQWLLDETPFASLPARVLHLNNRTTYGAMMQEQDVRTSFDREMASAAYFGVGRVVMHYNDKSWIAEMTREKMLEDLRLIHEMGDAHGVDVCIENTLFAHDKAKGTFGKAGVSFYDRLLGIATDEGFSRIGFCFDMGHGKVFSGDDLDAWFGFISRLDARGVPLHFHLHNNRGTKDEHLGFHQTEEMDLNWGDSYTGGRFYAAVLEDIYLRFSGMKVLETPAEEALGCWGWVLKNVRFPGNVTG